jgi:cobalt-zinc-cadmium efflux system outer membrane protein
MEDQRAAIDMNARWAVLAAAWAGAPDQRETAAGDLFALPHPADYTAAAAMVDRNPDILRFASERRLQDSALRLAEAARTADITVSAGIRRLQADRAQAAVLSVSMPLGAAGRNRPAEDELRSRLSGLQFEESNRRSDVLAALYAAYQHLNEGRARLEGIRSRALPLAEAAVKAAENAFRVGRFSLLELNLAQQQSLDLQRDAIVTAAANHLLVLEIDRLIGAPVPEMEISP